MTKKRNKVITTSIRCLLVAVLAIMAFIRGPLQMWLLLAAFLIFLLVVCVAFINARRQRQQYTVQKARRVQVIHHENQGAGELFVPDLDDAQDTVLLQHANHRVTARLNARYPDVSWEWLSENPAEIVKSGGEARIRVFGAETFNEAIVIFDRHANIRVQLVQVLSLEDGADETRRVPAGRPVDVSAWYDISARGILDDLVPDLNSRGYTRLTIREGGEIVVGQDSEEIVEDTLFNMPDPVHWQLVAKMIAQQGIAADVEDDRIIVSWR